MLDYYAILGITSSASDSEIKTAFRKLAKTYHPDKNPNNPNANNLFEQVLKAYNVLINTNSRKHYDYLYRGGVNTKTQYKHPQNKSQKNWTFTDEDLKRRNYYKTYYKHTQKTFNAKQTTSTYSDYKYILFATPLAVGLLMIVVSMFTAEPVIKTKIENNSIKKDTLKTQIPIINN